MLYADGLLRFYIKIIWFSKSMKYRSTDQVLVNNKMFERIGKTCNVIFYDIFLNYFIDFSFLPLYNEHSHNTVNLFLKNPVLSANCYASQRDSVNLDDWFRF